MPIADANGPTYMEPPETSTLTPEAVEEILVNEEMETTTSAVEQPTPLSEATPADVSNPSWVILLLVVLALAGVGVYQVLKGRKDGKKKVANKRK